MNDHSPTYAKYSTEYLSLPTTQPQWIIDLNERLIARGTGTESEELLRLKPETEVTVRHFAADFIPEEAMSIAQIAHLAELLHHERQGPAIRQDLLEVLHASSSEVEELPYIEAILTDLPVIADFARQHDIACSQYGQEFVDIEGLVNIAESTNLESIIIKAALDYSNFQLLEKQDSLSEKEQQKMRRIITTIKTIDATLLEITGFDALATEILSKAYEWELKQSGDGRFVEEARHIFDQFGGRNELGKTTELIIRELFPEDNLTHEQVTHDQESYEMYFGDGTTTIPGSDTTYRILARLKSVGATAKKMHRTHQRLGEIKSPADIIGLTLIAPDNHSIEDSIRYVMSSLPENATYIQAPNRQELLHIKGSEQFVATFGAPEGLLSKSGMSMKKEVCDNGYEAVKMAFLYPINGIHIPVEIQFTHEDARRESRIGLGSHTLFKLTKLVGHGKLPTIKLSSDDLAMQLQRIARRKELISKNRYVINEDSAQRIEQFRSQPESTTASLAKLALKS